MNKRIQLDLRQTQVAIKMIKDHFESKLAEALNLTRVSAPLFVRPETGLNDNLSGVEKAVGFKMRKYNIDIEIVQSLAKWKRMALKLYGFEEYEGLYADMDAIRADEYLDNTHSIYVDQWDWEMIIRREDRNEAFLKKIVTDIYNVFKETENFINEKYQGHFSKKLPENLFFINSQELLNMYPDLSPEERESRIAEKHGAVFIIGIGGKLSCGTPHGSRSPDYDDWNLNGDIIFWNPVLNAPIELSSMGIRVDESSLKNQLEEQGKMERMSMNYHRALSENELPLTIGGGIGQSRICMFFLEKKHIGEVQASVWDDSTIQKCNIEGIKLL